MNCPVSLDIPPCGSFLWRSCLQPHSSEQRRLQQLSECCQHGKVAAYSCVFIICQKLPNPTRTPNNSAQLFPGNFYAVLCQSCQHCVADVARDVQRPRVFPFLNELEAHEQEYFCWRSSVVLHHAAMKKPCWVYRKEVNVISLICGHLCHLHSKHTLFCKIIAKDFQKTKK